MPDEPILPTVAASGADPDAVEQRVRAAVTALGIDGLEVRECDPALADTAAYCEAYGWALEDSANAILVVGKADPAVYAVCVVLATSRLDVNRAVRARLGTRKASFAPAAVTTEITGMAIGGVTPVGLPEGLPLWIDSRVVERDQVLVGGGSRSAKVVGPSSFLLALPGAEVVDDLAIDPPPA